ncbi:Uncharacterised protein [Cedecea neteri]|uniref:Uncharacterized protein n=1 Tax=Cedecea neteri TaxID=158822 RepID=A0A2X2VD05_9ENTR|nr:Uncharacterised protein [Cedecea neteri]
MLGKDSRNETASESWPEGEDYFMLLAMVFTLCLNAIS